jgi:hypothetical protein
MATLCLHLATMLVIFLIKTKGRRPKFKTYRSFKMVPLQLPITTSMAKTKASSIQSILMLLILSSVHYLVIRKLVHDEKRLPKHVNKQI